jgi:hypothetical protein
MHTRAIILCCLIGTAGQATAQSPRSASDSTKKDYGGWMIGASVGIPGYRSESAPELFTFGFHFTQMQPNRVGGELSIGTMPRAVAERVAVIGVRGNFALPVELGRYVLVVPSAGLSMVGAAGPGGGTAALIGVNGSLATVLWLRAGVGARAGMSWHSFENSNGAVWLAEFGFVVPTRDR